MKSKNINNDLLGIVAIVVGMLLITWGLSYFAFPVLLVIIGIMLISYGLKAKNLPPLKVLVVKLISKLR